MKAEGIDQQVVNGISIDPVAAQAVNTLRFDIVMTPKLAADPVVAAAQQSALQAVFDEGQTLGVEVRFPYAN